MKIIVIIPARFSSSRFPGKPLVDIGGKPMIQRVYEQAQKAKGITKIIVATDDARIEKVVKKFGGNVVMTSPGHESGTDRCAEVIKYTNEEFDIVINVQGDEPFIHPEQIEQVAKTLAQHNTEIASLVRVAKHNEDVFDPSKVKVTLDYTKKALYFSRSPIPYNRQANEKNWIDHTDYYLHVGIYGYRADVLREISALPPGKLEMCESLEQLRWLENGYAIHMDITTHESYGIDTKEDLEKIKHLL
jgi:3-deoxy-manno-octulosonate cytidylyltransferase (CMP-KDO synthetase)